jgi:hypothetical protein
MKKMNKVFAVSLLVVYLMVMMRPFTPYLNYAVNKEYIATTLCENKGKPMMHCNGKCHLEKELKKTAKEDSKQQTSLRINAEEYISINPEDVNVVSGNLYIVISKINSPYLEDYSFNSINKIFHPPLV